MVGVVSNGTDLVLWDVAGGQGGDIASSCKEQHGQASDVLHLDGLWKRIVCCEGRFRAQLYVAVCEYDRPTNQWKCYCPVAKICTYLKRMKGMGSTRDYFARRRVGKKNQIHWNERRR